MAADDGGGPRLAWPGHTARFHFVPSFLSPEEQIALLKGIDSWYGEHGVGKFKPRSFADACRQSNRLGGPPRFLLGVSDRVPAAWATSAEKVAATTFLADARGGAALDCVRVNATLSDHRGKLGEHCDNMDGWAVLFSLGCSVEFAVREPGDVGPRVLAMHSGDAIAFDGGADACVMHEVVRVMPGTCPEHVAGSLGASRVGVQIRCRARPVSPSGDSDDLDG